MRNVPTFVAQAHRLGVRFVLLGALVAPAGPVWADALPPAPPMSRMPIIPDPRPIEGPAAATTPSSPLATAPARPSTVRAHRTPHRPAGHGRTGKSGSPSSVSRR